MKEKKQKWLGKAAVLLCLLAAGAAYLFVPSVRESFGRIAAMFASGDFTVVREFVASYGSYAAAVSFGLMILQSVAAPLPAFLLTFANANLFGWWQGAILSWTSAMAGAAVCFYIARILGRDAAGLTSMSFWSFFIATGIGQLPATLVYSYVGGMLTGGARLFVTGLMILFALSALIVMLRRIYMEKQRKKQ